MSYKQQKIMQQTNGKWKQKCLACNIMISTSVQQRHEESFEHIMNNITKLCEKCDRELYIIHFENAENDDLCKKCKQKSRKKICRECKDLFEPLPLFPRRSECPKCNEESTYLKFDNIVYIDLETSDLAHHSPQILEIAARSNDGIFSRFCHPYMPISKDASKINGLRSKNGVLYKNGIQLSNIESEQKVLRDFVDWLPKTRFAFVSYNIKFDKTVLCQQLSRYGIKISSPHRWFCAMKYVESLEGRRISLKKAMKKNGLEFDEKNLHGALYDTQCLKSLFEVLIAENFMSRQIL